MRGTLESVGQILETLSHRRRWGRRVVEGKALLLWEDVVGESLRAHTQAVRVDGGRLVVTVEDAVWKQEISLLRGEIIEKLNDRMGSDIIRDIVLVVR